MDNVTINFIMRSEKGSVFGYDTTYKTLAETRSDNGIDVHYYICLERVIDEEEEIHVLDLTKMMREVKAIAKAVNWAGILSVLTEANLIEYAEAVALPTHIRYTEDGMNYTRPNELVDGARKGPKIYSIEHNLDIQVDYGVRTDPSLRNHKHLTWLSPDIIFRHTNPNKPVLNLDNCIPIINGCVCYPKIYENELFAYSTTDLMASTSDRDKNILLMDFSNCGDIDVIRMSDCSISQHATTDRFLFVLPEGKSMKNKTPIVVIANRFVFHHELRIASYDAFALDHESIGLKDILFANQVLRNKFITNTHLIKLIESPVDYLQTITNVDNYENFIILVDTPKLSIDRTVANFRITPNCIIFPPNKTGLLMNAHTREIFDYVRVDMMSSMLAFITTPFNMHIYRQDDLEGTDTVYGFDKNLCGWCDAYYSLDVKPGFSTDIGSLELVDITSGADE